MDNELIIGVVAVIVTQLFQFFKSRAQISKIDKKQSAEINELKNLMTTTDNVEILSEIKKMQTNLNYLTELHKYTAYAKTLERKIEEVTDNVLVIKSFKQKEVLDMLISGKEKSLKVFQYILNNEFNFEDKTLKDSILVNLKSVKIHINHAKLEIVGTELFVERLEGYLNSLVDIFIIDLQEIKTLENGKRLELFEKICLSFLKNIYLTTINLYREFS